MTVREQLVAGVARVRATFDSGGPLPVPDWPRCDEFTLEARLPALPQGAMRRALGRVNVAETGGAAAGHLLVAQFRSHRADDGDSVRVVARLMYCDQPWNSFTQPAYPEGDFDALLDALEPGSGPPDVPPDRDETWHDRPGLL